MNLDQRLTDASRAIADGLTAPAVDPAAVRSAARTNRRRTIGGVTVAAVAAAVAAIAVGGALLTGPSPEGPAPEPVDRPGEIGRGPVWYDDAGLHHGDVVEPTPVDLFDPDTRGPNGSVPPGALALVRQGALYLDPAQHDVWFHPWGGEPRIVGHDSYAGPGGDPDGDVAAWFEGFELVVYDTARGVELSRTLEYEGLRMMPEGDHYGGGNGFKHISAEEVIWSADWPHIYRLDVATGESAPVSTLAKGAPIPELLDVHDGTRILANADFTGAVIEVEGREPYVAPVLEATARLSSDGSLLLAPTEGRGTHGAAILDVRSGERWDLLGEDWYVEIAWSYGDVAVIRDVRTPGPDRLFACDASERRCDPLPLGADVLLPTS